jgi:adenylate cyclase
MDPYLLMIRSVLDFYRDENRDEAVELTKKAFYMKADMKMTRVKIGTGIGDLKTRIFQDLMKEWAWPLELLEDLNRIEQWSYVRHLRFSLEINRFFSQTYSRLSRILRERKEQAIDAGDLTRLGRKMFALFSKRKNKILLTPFLTKTRRILERCLFVYSREAPEHSKWSLYDGSWYPYEKKGRRSRIFSSERLSRMASWMVFNGLYDLEQTVVEVNTNPLGLRNNDLMELIRHIQSFFFSPGTGTHEKDEDLLLQERKEKIMLLIDPENPSQSPEKGRLDIIYTNSWGELFTESYPFQEGLERIKAYAADLQAETAGELTARVRIHLPRQEKDNPVRKRIHFAVLEGLAD